MKKLFDSKLTLLLIIIAVSFATYINTVNNGFIIDDHFLIEKNPWIISFKNLPAIFTSDVHAFKTENPITDYYRPLLFTVYTLEYLLFGLRPWGWHLFNVLFHAINGILVFLIAAYLFELRGRTSSYETTADKRISPNAYPFAAALIFAAHPMNAEAVNWLACVCELSYTLFSLLALYLYMLSTGGYESLTDAVKPAGTLRALSVLSFLFAMFSKETALVVPGILLAYDYAAKKRPFEGLLKRHVFYWAAAAFYILLRLNALHGIVTVKNVSEGPLYYISSVFIIFAGYLWIFISTAGLNIYHIVKPAISWTEPRFLFSAVVTTAFFVILWRVSKKERTVILLSSIIVLPLLPTFYLLTKNTDIYYINIMAERFFYLPMAGLVILIGLGVENLTKKARTERAVTLIFILIFAVVAVYSVRSFFRNRFWSDDYTIFKTSTVDYPDNYFAHYMLGGFYFTAGQKDLAIAEFTEANRLRPTFTGSHHKLGLIYYSMGLLPRAEEEFRAVLKVNPENGDAYYNIALIFMDENRWDDAVVELKKAITYSRGSRIVSARNALAVCYARTGRLEDAKKELQEALMQAPTDKETLENIRVLGNIETR